MSDRPKGAFGFFRRWQVRAAIAVVLLGAAVLLAVASAIEWVHYKDLSSTATGQVVERGLPTVHGCGVEVRFEVGDTAYTATNNPACIGQVGDSVELRYDGDDPTRSIVGAYGQVASVMVLGGIASMVLLIGGLVVGALARNGHPAIRP
ncbi:DUF3592 domain-containing protein [Nocardioides montaniterrae]